MWSQDGTIIGRLVLPGEEDSTSVVFSPAPPGHFYVSHGDKVSLLDPRNLKSPVEEFRGAAEEEINALALNETGSALAVADDSGAVRVLELPGGKVCRTLRRHTNICSSVAFRPHRPNNLLSAGLDMQVRLVDFAVRTCRLTGGQNLTCFSCRWCSGGCRRHVPFGSSTSRMQQTKRTATSSTPGSSSIHRWRTVFQWRAVGTSSAARQKMDGSI